MASNTTIPYWKSPEYNGRFFLDLNASLIAVTTAVIAMRLYSRGFMTKSLGLDDALAFVAFVCKLLHNSRGVKLRNNNRQWSRLKARCLS